MIAYKLEEFKNIVNGEYIDNCQAKSFKYLLTDSRLLSNPSESVFFAINGKNHNGNDYIKDLYKKGVCNFVIESDININSNQIDTIKSLFPKANFLIVDNTISALQEFALMKRQNFTIPVIGITGSNGKTIIKEWLFELLHKDKNIIRSPKSYNSQIGVPLSVWLLQDNTEMGIFEAGISKIGEMSKIVPIIKPDIGILTNINDAHQENFANYEQKLSEKLILFKDTDIIFYNKDDKSIREKMQAKEFAGKKLISWSKKYDANLKINNIIRQRNNTIIMGEYENNKIEISIPFTDDASVENAIFCLLYLLYFDYDIRKFKASFNSLLSVEMRLELIQGKNNCLIINDSYNSDIESLSIAIDFLINQNMHKKKTIIISDILQINNNEEMLYKNIADIVNNKNISRLIGIGTSISKYKRLFKTNAIFFNSTEQFLKSITEISFKDEVILLKGAREFEFEKLSELFQKKVHETVLEINLEAIIYNYNYFKSLLKRDTKIMVMVKAFSYGSGSYEIANLLQAQDADYLAVANIDEGIDLRKGGITMPIMVINPKTTYYDLMIENKLEAEIFSFNSLELFIKTLKKRNMGNYPIHIKIDTGMNRLGFTADEIPKLIELIQYNNEISVKSVFSHLATSEDKSNDLFTRKQIAEFNELSTIITKKLNYPIIRHILNSAGIERFTDYQFDMVRLGIGLYGFSAINSNKLMPVSILKSTIIQIKKIKENDTIGYGRRGKLNAGSKIAIVPIGYADGLSRKLGNSVGQLYIRDNPVPIIGNISMDMCAVDITNISVNEGDEVIIFDNNNHILKMSESLKTIPYEIMTNISQRVKRIYLQ